MDVDVRKGTTSVVPNKPQKSPGFSPCGHFLRLSCAWATRQTIPIAPPKRSRGLRAGAGLLLYLELTLHATGMKAGFRDPYFVSPGVVGGGGALCCTTGGAGAGSVTPLIPSLKPFNPSPSPLPSSGSRLAPKSRNATTPSTIKCHGCKRSPIFLPPRAGTPGAQSQ